MVQFTVLAASLVSVLASIFAMHKAHEVHITSLGSRVVSLEKQIEDARAHELTLETRIALLEKELDRSKGVGVGAESKITEALAAHAATMERTAEVRHLRELYYGRGQENARAFDGL